MIRNDTTTPRPSHAVRRAELESWTDEALMDACAEGQDDAYAVLVDRYAGKIISFIARIVGNREIAEDLSQEVFVRIHRHRKNYRKSGKFTSWLYTIAVNLARNELRSVRRRGSAVPIDPVTGMNESGTLHLVEGGMLSDEELHRSDTALLVRRAVAGLAPHHREVLILRDLQELTYAEVGDILGIPGGTVRSRLNRARIALKEKLMRMVPGIENSQALNLALAGESV